MFRHIPHPNYGHYGGAKARCNSHELNWCPSPIDGLDLIYRMHDTELRKAKTKKAQKKADKRLAHRLWRYRGKYAKPLYGRFYHVASFVVFKIVSCIPF